LVYNVVYTLPNCPKFTASFGSDPDPRLISLFVNEIPILTFPIVGAIVLMADKSSVYRKYLLSLVILFIASVSASAPPKVLIRLPFILIGPTVGAVVLITERSLELSLLRFMLVYNVV
jgi:hypothetical protein